MGISHCPHPYMDNIVQPRLLQRATAVCKELQAGETKNAGKEGEKVLFTVLQVV